MRTTAALLIIAGLVTAFHLADAQQKLDAGAVMVVAREALGGEKKLSAVRSFTFTGPPQQMRGENLG